MQRAAKLAEKMARVLRIVRIAMRSESQAQASSAAQTLRPSFR